MPHFIIFCIPLFIKYSVVRCRLQNVLVCICPREGLGKSIIIMIKRNCYAIQWRMASAGDWRWTQEIISLSRREFTLCYKFEAPLRLPLLLIVRLLLTMLLLLQCPCSFWISKEYFIISRYITPHHLGTSSLVDLSAKPAKVIWMWLHLLPSPLFVLVSVEGGS